VTIPQGIAWRLFTKWIAREDAIARSTTYGDEALAAGVFRMTSVIA
jgi:hypothetical protein